MTVQEIANRLVELCRMGEYDKAQDELYSAYIVSIEPEGTPGVQRAEGIDAVKEKGQMFQSMIEEMYGNHISDPLIAGNFISIMISMDAKLKGQERSLMDEIAVYEVRDGKIVTEQFFF